MLCCLQESIRGCDVFLVQPTCPPVNDNLMELLVTIDACRRASARSITAVLPYYGYARADRKTQVRGVVISSSALAWLAVLGLEAATGVPEGGLPTSHQQQPQNSSSLVCSLHVCVDCMCDTRYACIILITASQAISQPTNIPLLRSVCLSCVDPPLYAGP